MGFRLLIISLGVKTWARLHVFLALAALVVGVMTVPAPADARPIVYFVFETDNDTVYRLEDLNGDGDANDPGAGWAFGTIYDVEGLDVDQRNGDLYTSEEGPELIYRYRDINGDGDALDAGEKFLYADDSGLTIPGVDGIENIAIDESSNTIYTVYEDEDVIIWHRDINGDGDALDIGESGLFANVGYDLEAIAVNSSTGDVYACDVGEDDDEDDVFRLLSDGTNMGSVGRLGHEACDFNDNTGELFAGDEDFTDINRYVGGVANIYGNVPNGSEALAVDPIGNAVFAGDYISFAVIYRYRDLNGDGDALDVGERNLFHDFIPSAQSEYEIEGLAVYGNLTIAPTPGALDEGITSGSVLRTPKPGDSPGAPAP